MPIGNGGIIGPANVPTITTASGVWSLREQQQAQGRGAWPLALLTDPYFEYTTLLLPGNGTNGANNNTFLDGSTNNFTITRSGNTTQGTFSPFSQTGWGNYFDGTGDNLALPSSSNLAFGTGNFCVEAWVYWTTTGVLDAIYSNLVNSAGGDAQFNIQLTAGNKVQVTGWATTFLTGATSVVSNTWNHIAVCRSGTTLSIFLNGTRDATTTSSNNWSSTNAFYIGDYPAGGAAFSGYISNLRVVKGSTPYDATSSTLTVPTAPLTAITNTQLLTCQSNRFIDNSTNNFTITRNGDTSVVAFSPFNPTLPWIASINGGSGYFDGSGDYLTVPAQTALSFAGDFTIETWIYITSNPSTNYGLLDARASAGTLAAWVWDLFNSSGTKLDFIYGAARLTSASTVPINQWVHLVVSRVGSTIRQFINGTVDANTATTSAAINASRTDIYIGNLLDASTALPGYMSGIRVVNGSGVTSVTVPTSPPTAITNTSLLLNFTNAGIYDATSKNDLETVADAQISNTTAKWGSTSIKFDGTGDRLLVPSNVNLDFGSGSFTIEFWMYTGNVSTRQDILDRRATAAITGWMLSMNIVTAARLTFYASGPGWPLMTSSSNISSNTWTHVAIVRNGSAFAMYQDGVSVASATSSTAMSDNNYFLQVGNSIDNVYFNGYIQDLRITKGYARYTANFTPPTAAFPTL